MKDLQVNYTTDEGLQITITVPMGYDDTQNLPYYLAELFDRIITESSANAEMIIQELTEKQKYK